ncbi:hypothetical protein CEXT_724081 [Caerostris extrusa]|uniref:Uncharacterized protein n=1 Tax=Caerostris extrusa TaxID=172846 RepID=A0AAV4QNQ3_CAEEX|nr:hypothetical protein CEXT_724081 [Caerostris extrusa]
MAGSKGRDPQTLLEEASLVLKHFQKIRGTERRPRSFFFGPSSLFFTTLLTKLWELSLVAWSRLILSLRCACQSVLRERSRITKA